MSAGLKIIEPGIAATVQDSGRPGLQRFGVPVSGALDAIGLAIANFLVGNGAEAAAIEIIGAGLAIEIEAGSATLAVAGSVGPLMLESRSASMRIAPMQSFSARHGDLVRVPAPSGGAVCYLAVAGGFALAPALGSLSTYRRAAIGGFHGRALAKGDVLPLRLPFSERPAVRLDVCIKAPTVLRAMRGPNEEYFSEAAFQTLFAAGYSVAPASDRMGLRLQGPPIERAIAGELPSEGTTAGALQIPADGQPILLLADRQTTGGYPRIATVIGADLPAAGRLGPGMSLRFEAVSRADAVRLLKEQRDWLASLPSRLRPAAAEPLSTERLLAANLIGGVTAGALQEGEE